MTKRQPSRSHIPPPSSDEAKRRMRAQRQRDTKPEIAVRSILAQYDVQFTVDQSPVPGMRRRADIVFTTARVAVFVDGCFWHGCPFHGTWPKNNAVFWRQKIETNQQRDRDTDRQLEAAGWRVIRAWEHEAPEAIVAQILTLLHEAAPPSSINHEIDTTLG